jgi:hypothetical protein
MKEPTCCVKMMLMRFMHKLVECVYCICDFKPCNGKIDQ